ncbi:SDR family NAD(P)-dependent oxidoreductase [Pseudonocardia sp. DSM 110487]|uniref:SDR family NAD(P)-dependent oxidoreductase n=1 Tax=Pseudonocardia sp. DSM 110487 TaxID=2865833 RepID=UPI001C6A3106|nr:SDR family NAD(P)-dependent oxidoreductase [Pseudonocardia sp. DSM 110487]QYN33086.1 SDR family NAD(P)-dependent oxidoreductase [Pseudonocardia sp. DSM 110487]
MQDRIALITGSTGGIGKETARGLARLGAHVVLVGRDPQRAAAAAEEMRLDTGNGAVDALTADVSRQADLHRLAAEVGERYGRLDVLVNNAAIVRERRELTEDGVEAMFAANVLAPFLLTHLLLPVLRAAAPGRAVNLTGAIPRGRLDLDNLQGERRYPWFINQTKRALMAMSYEFATRCPAGDVTINVAYPGHAYTDMNRGLSARTFPLAARPLVPLLKLVLPIVYGGDAVAKASRSSVRLASDPSLTGVSGTYFDTRGRPAPWPACARDERNRDVVWALCERLSGRSAPRAMR